MAKPSRSLQQQPHDRPGSAVRAEVYAVVRHVKDNDFRVEFPNIDPSKLQRAERVLSVDCGLATIRHGMPEVHLGQLDPFDGTKLVRVVSVRYDVDRFKERLPALVKMKSDIIESIGKIQYKPGYFSNLMKVALPPQGSATALLDVELDYIARLGAKAYIIFFGSGMGELIGSIVHAKNSTTSGFRITPELEVTMSLMAILDLADSWKEVAEKL